MSSAGKLRIAFAVLFFILVGIAVYRFLNINVQVQDDRPADPRLSSDSPFRNIRPDVTYVGDSACAECHTEIESNFHRHPMGRSASLIAEDKLSQNFRFKTKSQTEFVGSTQSDAVTHSESTGMAGNLIVSDAKVIATIGSGTRGKSYLCNRESSLWQSGASWFSGDTGWDASPGFWPGRHARRAIIAECLYCHVNHAEPIEGSINRYKEPFFGNQLSIGCERCHGPGSIHVAERTVDNRKDGRMDTSIVNPKHLPPSLREDICRQCHLQGEVRFPRRGRESFDYRPGLPLEEFIGVFLPHPLTTDYSKSVGQVEQISLSKCDANSGGKFGCVSCHDPHSVPEPTKKDEYYRQRCMKCHEEKGCNLPESQRLAKNNSCIACHMPRGASSSIVHAAVTDHRIMRKPFPSKSPMQSPPPGELPLINLGGSAQWPQDPERSRDMAIAISLTSKHQPAIIREAMDRLKEATERHRSDVDAWEALSSFKLLQKDYDGALLAAESAIKLQPEREKALAKGAETALLAGKPEKAGEFARKAMILNPGHPDHRLRLAESMLDRSMPGEAEQELVALLKVTPNHAFARVALAVSMYKQGRAREALTELERAVSINPQDNRELRTWFTAKTR